jgi:pimeloyl-ACP methyl ester carboxylesterase
MFKIKTGKFLDRLPFARVGEGLDAILIINGGQGFMMRPETSRLRRDASRLGWIIPDGRSFVLLGYDPKPGDVSVSSIADDIADIIDNEFGGRCQLVGVSYGAVVAANVASRFQHRVSRLALVAGGYDFSPEGKHRLHRQAELARSGQSARLLQEFSSVFRRPWFNFLLKLRIRLNARKITGRLSSPATICRYLDAMLTYQAGDHQPGAEGPDVLVVLGSRDQFFSRPSVLYPRVKIAVLEGETHMAPVERPADVKAILSSFLATSQ